MRALLIQARKDDETLAEEFNEFVRFSGVPTDAWDTINLFDGGRFESSRVDTYDFICFGGSSQEEELHVQHPAVVSDAKALVRHCVAKDIPTFASCYGFELAVEALGGELVDDERNVQELNCTIELTEVGKRDVLFAEMPAMFEGISWHKHRAGVIPEQLEVLATANTCPVEVFRVKGARVYGFQFHPELDAADVRARLTRYIDLYPDQKAELENTLAKLQETPVANNLLRAFIERVVQPAL